MELWSVFLSYFWSTNFWFPPNVSWDSMKNTDDGVYHAQREDLYYVFPIAAILTILRKLFESYVGAPLARYYGLKERTSKPNRQNPVLDEAFTHSKTPEHKDIVGLSKKTGLTVRQVEIWFRVQRNINKPNKFTKFTEASWRFAYYFCVFIAGFYILWDKPWFNDTNQCWKGFPHHSVPNDVFWYYLIQMAFYVSLFFSQFFDVKRKDFYEMLIHHTATISLMFISWCNNLFRMGTLVLIVHDANDYLLEFSKILTYVKSKNMVSVVFGLFVITWIVTRLIIFPFWIINSTMFEAVPIVGMCNIYYLYNLCFIILQILHVIWFYFIMKVLIHAVSSTDAIKDSRSDTDSSEETNINGALTTTTTSAPS